ncbi:PREDICTED: uncharacterized protein LOC108660625 [Theobroma cacao]|uniref:Uncharacterized protein LOC108660625 n=1 Tax=Theobroma cacao TaxID=3641 RepID=A0AB32VV54_THECC|nr:PREDICTED: uncharacterized protein LOC108660625 [Theobroma cacao]
MTKTPFTGKAEKVGVLIGLIHLDVCGPLKTPARGGYSYFITFIDDHSRFGYVYLIKYKFETFEKFKEFKAERFKNHKLTSLLELESTVEALDAQISTQETQVLRRSIRQRQLPKRYRFMMERDALPIDKEPTNYEKAIFDIDSDKWLEAMKSEMDAMHVN